MIVLVNGNYLQISQTHLSYRKLGFESIIFNFYHFCEILMTLLGNPPLNLLDSPEAVARSPLSH